MAEKVIVRQNNRLETQIFAPDPHGEIPDKLHEVRQMSEITPFGLLLASLGLCTAELLHTYAKKHGVDLQEVELILQYERLLESGCRYCEDIVDYREQIIEEINVKGDINTDEKEKLLRVSHRCPVHKIVKHGMSVISRIKVSREKGTSHKALSKG